ncbi:Stp1/IreP family PP2C-type Ser/Thr phosphatase [Weissella viridescens]|uniref:Stp1/IreP family PP2C-type Ser/Thr phosphatase n=1 Tax=Weissella viridescens TaxID=1629 RepID=UPI001746706F|nr:Stp1/IreP family PP2C-type Ser/Thr phosphatase [Weissella viridescens]MBX4172679.1 Stp1/IreP family PP2C-type Ser/Thr phosphatase [Weissella viridescens]MCB6840404.1 Stp1/IreP family PP2C-type Ser/Thr phosphatase [Weissella viridescens]MCB6847137.1 Stp1/IreP family PP2C-type Ser/Thr phosphatase [Weissella viridescens]QOD86562.1 Stp1/IreP family PP2C-type Ser/Thr phosphatase [Weissella viridescens]
MKIAYATDTGRVRADNQDYVGAFKNQLGVQLAIVADGVGGEQAGDVASNMAVSHLGNAWRQATVQTIAEAKTWIVQAIQQENATILETAGRYRTLEGMATTIVLAVIFPDQICFGNLGDSRAYMLRNAQLFQITEDHNLAQELVRAGSMTPDEASANGGRNVLTRQLGVNEETEIDLFDFALQPGDEILLTTDGLVKHLSDQVIYDTLTQVSSMTEAVSQLIQQTNEAGGSDNVTVLLGYQESEDA